MKTPEKRARMLHDIPVIRDDPTMDPKYESEEDKNENDKKQDMYKSSVDSRFSKRRDYLSKETRRDIGADATSSRFKPHSENLSFKPSSTNETKKIVSSTKDVSESGPKVNETEKMWHYKHPSGKNSRSVFDGAVA